MIDNDNNFGCLGEWLSDFDDNSFGNGIIGNYKWYVSIPQNNNY